MSFKTEKFVRGKKSHVCDWCGERIEPREKHVKGASGNGKNLDSWRLHMECYGAVQRTLNEFPDDDGCPLPGNMTRGMTPDEADQKARGEA